MKFYLNQKVFDKDENDAIYSELETMGIKDADIAKDQLIDIFNITKDAGIRDKIALFFSDLYDEDLVPVLIKKIDEIRYSKHITTLIYACSGYDCAEWIVFFVGLAIEFDDSTYIEAIGVIEEIRSPIKLSDRIVSAKLLMERLSTMEKDNEKYKAIESLLELIEDMEVVVL